MLRDFRNFPPVIVLTTILLPKQQSILMSLYLWIVEEGERCSEGGMILLEGLFRCFKASCDGCKARSDGSVRKGLLSSVTVCLGKLHGMDSEG